MSVGCVIDGGNREATPFSRFLIFLGSKGETGGKKRVWGAAPQCREVICSALCFTFNVKREDIAGIFGQTHKKQKNLP